MLYLEIMQQQSKFEPAYGQNVTEDIADFESRINVSLETYREVGRIIEEVNFLVQNNLLTAIIKIK